MNSWTAIVIVRNGNRGRGVRHAIARSPDTILAGIISRDPQRVAGEVGGGPLHAKDDEKTWRTRLVADVAVICGGSAADLPEQGPYFETMDAVARKAGTVPIISTGRDPGTFSLERVLADAFIPGASHYTFWGRGVSQGHSDAARPVKGVKDARHRTIPIPKALERVRSGGNPSLRQREKHRRLVLASGATGGRNKVLIEYRILDLPAAYPSPHPPTSCGGSTCRTAAA